MTERAHRIGTNEALFREVNEKIEGLNEAFGAVAGTMTIVCECGDGTCTRQLEVDPELYERIRSDPQLFAVVPGHVAGDLEDVVERHAEVEIVRKRRGEPERIAERSYPRR